MLKYNKEIDLTEILLPTYTSCAGNNKVDPRQFLLNQGIEVMPMNSPPAPAELYP